MRNDIKDIIKKVAAPSKRVYINRNNFDNENKRAVIYSRVSTKFQESNGSLITQKQKSDELISGHGLSIINEFGNTSESGKTMLRKEFTRMEEYIKDKRNNIAYVVVYDMDRFARDLNGILTIDEWRKKYKIRILSVSAPNIPQTDADFINQNQAVLNSYSENSKRRDKFLDGNIRKLREGVWTFKVRAGYKRSWEGKKSTIVHDENAKYIKVIFELRGNQLMEVPEIYQHLCSLGCNKIKEKNIYRILQEPFYCGYYTHGLLREDEVIKGTNFEPIISESLFNKVNTIFQDKNRKVRHEYPELCLKSFVKCDTCGKNLTAYYKKDKDKFYYKCGTKGCKFNRSSEKMEDAFVTLLRCLKLTDNEKVKVRAELIGLTGDFVAKNDELNKKLSDKLLKLEEGFKKVKINRAMNEIDQDVYLLAKEQIENDITKTRQELKKPK
jgi:DNA invertase Pin-like site-specific DNA recombinase